jgi:5-methylcytosine-specific restriction endonuclease McrA
MKKASGARGPYSSSRWRREAAAFLAQHTLCACGCEERSSFVDHIIPVRDGGSFWDRSNWQAMARRCHFTKSRVEQGQRGDLPQVKHTRVRIDPATGLPIGPGHWWNEN